MNKLAKMMVWVAPVVWLSACGTTGEVAEEAAGGDQPPTEERSVDQEPAPTVDADEDEDSGAEALALPEEEGFQGHPLDNPESPLSDRTIYFEFDSSEVQEEYRSLVEAHAEYLADHPDTRVTLEGHTDERGSREYNVALGERRAQSVQQLMLLMGASQEQLKMVSYGEEQPAALGHNEDAWRLNRRVEIVYTRR